MPPSNALRRDHSVNHPCPKERSWSVTMVTRRPFWCPAAASAAWSRPTRWRARAFRCACSSKSPEFREVGAGIQLGPNIFRVLDKIGLKDAVLADAHRPPAQEMRDALTGKLITHIPLGARLHRALRPALCGHPSRRHPRHLPERLPGQQPDHAGNQPARRRLRGPRRRRHRHARKRRTGRRPRADRLRRHVVEDPRAHRRRRQAAGVRPYRLSRRAQARRRARRPVAARRGAVGRPAHPFRALSAAPRRTLQSGRGVPLRSLRGRLERGRQHRSALAAFQGPACRKCCACSSASRPGACGCCATASR